MAEENIIGNYRQVKCILTGQTTQVWEVVEVQSHRHFAMKLLLPTAGSDAKAMLYHEANVGIKLTHQNVIRIVNVSNEYEHHYFVMEYFPSGSLKSRLVQKQYDFIRERAHSIFKQAATGLAYMNASDWVHRDIKPDNLLVNSAGDLRIIDFAIAQKIENPGFFGSLFRRKPNVQGTRSYMSPEQIRGQPLDGRADIYSYGATLYELTTYRPPFRAATQQELLQKHIIEKPTPLLAHTAELTQEFNDLVLRCLAKKREDRPESFHDVLKALNQIRVYKNDPVRRLGSPEHRMLVLAANSEAIARASEILHAGGLVAFPTETVYGLGANALDAAAVARIFAAKGRPATNPIIVHVASVEEAKTLVAAWPERAEQLTARFWPGPLTLVLPKAACVPDLVTAGGPTVALRMPAHPVALALLRECRLPLAAPSANRSTELSPTCAQHVLDGLGAQIDLLLDGGPTPGGLESTVLDVTSDPPRLLRPGLVTVAELEAIVGPLDRSNRATVEPARSPGQMQRHYAPRTPLELTRDSRTRVEELRKQGQRVGWLTHVDTGEIASVLRIFLPADPVSYSAQLYAALHRLDDARLDRIVVELPPDGDAWLAVHDRLRRAAT